MRLLAKIQKGSTYEQLVQAAKRVKDSGIALSVTILLGIGGLEASQRHASETAKILTDMDPDFVGALSVIVVPGTPLHDEYLAGKFQVPDPFGLIEELRTMIAESSFTNCVFRSNHASNYLPVKATTPGRQGKYSRSHRCSAAKPRSSAAQTRVYEGALGGCCVTQCFPYNVARWRLFRAISGKAAN